MSILHIRDKPRTHSPNHTTLTVGSAASEKFFDLIQVYCPAPTRDVEPPSPIPLKAPQRHFYHPPIPCLQWAQARLSFGSFLKDSLLAQVQGRPRQLDQSPYANPLQTNISSSAACPELRVRHTSPEVTHLQVPPRVGIFPTLNEGEMARKPPPGHLQLRGESRT